MFQLLLTYGKTDHIFWRKRINITEKKLWDKNYVYGGQDFSQYHSFTDISVCLALHLLSLGISV